MTPQSFFFDYMESPIGFMMLNANDEGLTQAAFIEIKPTTVNRNSITDLAKQQLTDYFSGALYQFDLPLAMIGTQFQQHVWRQLQQIAFGETVSYKDIATAIDNPQGSQAVGQANGKNPIAVIIPCHRVIGTNNTLTGYAGGLERKQWLLSHETSCKQ